MRGAAVGAGRVVFPTQCGISEHVLPTVAKRRGMWMLALLGPAGAAFPVVGRGRAAGPS